MSKPVNDGTTQRQVWRGRGQVLASASLAIAILSLAAPSTAQDTTPSSAPSSTVPETTATVPTTTTTTIPSATTLTPISVPTSSTIPVSTIPLSTIPLPTVPTTASTIPTTVTVPSPTVSTSIPKPTTIPVPYNVPKKGVLKVGSKGDGVLKLEERLEELRIDIGKVDGRYDWSTWQGVMAFQKYYGLKRTGTVNAETAKRIEASGDLGGIKKVKSGNWLEVDLGRQITFLYRDGELYRVIAVSTGSGKAYCEIGRKSKAKNCGDAVTPTGNFRIQRRINGWRESDLGRLYNPLYFTGGIAFHGAPSVPAYPASHGCVRLPMPVAEWFPSKVSNGWPVFVYK